jgi:hypothetical protein
VLVYQAVAGSDGGVSGVSDPLPPTTVGTVSTGTTTPSTPGTATSSAAVSPTVKPPLLPAAATEPTPAGAEAFFRYFIEVFNYSYDALDPDALASISDPKCDFCRSAIDEVKDGQARQLRYEGGNVVVVGVSARSATEPHDALLNVLLRQKAGRTIDQSGAVEETLTAKDDLLYDARASWASGGWRLVGVAKGTTT